MSDIWFRSFVWFIAIAFLPTPVAVAERDYDACVAQIAEAPSDALEAARRWRLETGDLAARHCIALALVALDRFAEAAGELTELAAASADAPADHQAALFAQAGHAWLLADHLDLAEGAFDHALALTPGSPDRLLDRAQARLARGRNWEALDDLNAALGADPARLDALVFRAGIYRRLGARELASEDLARALATDPDNADALIERGMLSLAADDVAAARSDFGQVMVTSPGSEAAETARAFLAELDREAE